MILIAATITLLLAAGIFYFQTAEGTVRIEIKEPEVQVAFQDKTFTIDDNGTPIEVKPGKHKLLVKRGGLEVPTEEFTVSRNGDVAIQVTWLNGELKVLNDGNTIGSHRVPSESTPSSIGSSSRNSNQITLLRKLQGLPEGLEDLAFAPDGKSVVAASVTEVRRWNLEDGQTITSGKLPSKSRIMTMRLLRDNQRLLTGSFRGGKGIQLWNLHNLEMLSEFKGPPTETSHTWVCDVSPDNRLALTGGSDGIHRVWDLETGRELKQFDDKGSYGANAAFSPDGRRIAKGSWQALTILNVETLEIERTIPSLEMGKIAPVVFSPDNQFVLASGQGSSRGDLPMGLVLLEVKSGRRLHYISLPEPSYSCVFLPDGKHFLAGCTDKTIRVWNTHSGEEVFRVTTENYSTNYVAIAPDGRTLASGGGYFWDEEAKERGYASFDGDGHVYLWQLPESVWPKLTNQ